MNKAFMAGMVGVVALMIGIFALSGGKQTEETGTFEGNPREVQADDKVKGSENPKVTIIEYADFECPACANIYQAIKGAEARFADDLQFVFRHFPLTNIHPNANAAHRAAEAAGNQGKFFEMHDLLYENQAAWSAATAGLSTTQAIELFEAFAEQLGLDMEQYRADANSTEVFDVILANQASGNQLGIQATPTLFLNGEEIDTPRDSDSFYAQIQEAIDSAGSETE
jgi:protein-disulfide isomerase